MRACMCVCVCACMYVGMCACVHVCMCVCVCMCVACELTGMPAVFCVVRFVLRVACCSWYVVRCARCPRGQPADWSTGPIGRSPGRIATDSTGGPLAGRPTADGRLTSKPISLQSGRPTGRPKPPTTTFAPFSFRPSGNAWVFLWSLRSPYGPPTVPPTVRPYGPL